jgi:ubiquinone/menaquinone biosynthesis C-methylase UbiE
MAPDIGDVRGQQRRTWDRFAEGWQRWDPTVRRWLSPVGDAMIRRAHLQERSVVLDVATGTGEPGLSAAGLVPRGQVVLIDLAEHMLAVAAANAAERGLANVETCVGDAASLPFPDESFDAVLCRFGFMFFPDMDAAATELARVIRPGGRVSAAVWAEPDNNPWATLVAGAIAGVVVAPAVPPDSPGLFRCAPSGLMYDVLTRAGFRHVSDEEISCLLVHEDPEAYWRFMTDVAAPVVAGLAMTDRVGQNAIRERVLAEALEWVHDGRVRLAATARVVTGTR